MLVVVVLCGVPGSGKTTVCQAAKDRLMADGIQVRHIAFDDNVPADRSVWTERSFADSRAAGMGALHAALLSYTSTTSSPSSSSSSSSDGVVMVDDIMYLHSMRREVYVAARDGGAHHLLVVHVEAPLAMALARNAARAPAARVEEEAVRRMHGRFERPNGSLVHEKMHLTVDTSTDARCVGPFRPARAVVVSRQYYLCVACVVVLVVVCMSAPRGVSTP